MSPGRSDAHAAPVPSGSPFPAEKQVPPGGFFAPCSLVPYGCKHSSLSPVVSALQHHRAPWPWPSSVGSEGMFVSTAAMLLTHAASSQKGWGKAAGSEVVGGSEVAPLFLGTPPPAGQELSTRHVRTGKRTPARPRVTSGRQKAFILEGSKGQSTEPSVPSLHEDKRGLTAACWRLLCARRCHGVRSAGSPRLCSAGRILCPLRRSEGPGQ